MEKERHKLFIEQRVVYLSLISEKNVPSLSLFLQLFSDQKVSHEKGVINWLQLHVANHINQAALCSTLLTNEFFTFQRWLILWALYSLCFWPAPWIRFRSPQLAQVPTGHEPHQVYHLVLMTGNLRIKIAGSHQEAAALTGMKAVRMRTNNDISRRGHGNRAHSEPTFSVQQGKYKRLSSNRVQLQRTLQKKKCWENEKLAKYLLLHLQCVGGFSLHLAKCDSLKMLCDSRLRL